MKKKKEDFKSVDAISKDLDIVDNFVLKNWKKYIYIAVAIVIIVCVYIIVSKRIDANKAVASISLLSANTIQEMESSVKANSGSKLSDFVSLKLAAKLFNEKNYTESQNIYTSLLSKDSDNFVVSSARLGIAYINEAQGKVAESLTQFVSISNDASLSLAARCEAEYSAGRLYLQQGNKAQAIEILKRCANVNSDTCVGWPEMAQTLLNTIN